LAGILLAVLCGLAFGLSPQFDYGLDITRQPVLTWVSIQVLTGVCYFYGFCQLSCLAGTRGRRSTTLLILIVLVGLAMRGFMVASTPVLETDYYRYLWDGAMLANGHDPYLFTPAGIRNGEVPDTVRELAAASQPVLERINHPQVTTIYPLAAVSAFALAYAIDPWSIQALRGVYLGLDFVTLCLLAWVLRVRGRSALWLFVFWCNPLLVRFVYNGLHMDVIVVALLAVFISGVTRRGGAASALALGAAIGAKIWPAWLAVHLWIAHRMKWAAMSGVALGMFLLLPMMLPAQHTESGLLAYARHWEINDPVFRFLSLAAGTLAAPEAAGLWARAASAVLFLSCLAYLYGRQRRDDPMGTAVMVLGAFLVLLPAPYPWYFLWLLPFLVMAPAAAWIGLTATLPLYELRFFFEPRDMSAWFHYVVVPLEFSPLLLLLRRRLLLNHTVNGHVS